MSVKKRAAVIAVVIAVILVASVAAIIYMKSDIYMKSENREGRAVAYIYRDNELLEKVNLSDVDSPYSFRIEYGDGDYNDIEVRKGSIGIVGASCPDKLCEHMGFISDALMPITCLPNHLVIRIVIEGEEQPSLDSVVY